VHKIRQTLVRNADKKCGGFEAEIKRKMQHPFQNQTFKKTKKEMYGKTK